MKERVPTAAVQITTENLPNARFGRFYNQIMQASGGLGNYFWSVSEGSLPPGFRLDETTGMIRGKAVRSGIWNFQISVRDANYSQLSAAQNFSINITY